MLLIELLQKSKSSFFFVILTKNILFLRNYIVYLQLEKVLFVVLRYLYINNTLRLC